MCNALSCSTSFYLLILLSTMRGSGYIIWFGYISHWVKLKGRKHVCMPYSTVWVSPDNDALWQEGNPWQAKRELAALQSPPQNRWTTTADALYLGSPARPLWSQRYKACLLQPFPSPARGHTAFRENALREVLLGLSTWRHQQEPA